MIKVIIERKIASGLEKNYHQAIKQALSSVLNASGYLSGESFMDVNQPNHRFIVVSWSSIAAWEKWLGSPERATAIADITPLLDGEEKITLLAPS